MTPTLAELAFDLTATVLPTPGVCQSVAAVKMLDHGGR